MKNHVTLPNAAHGRYLGAERKCGFRNRETRGELERTKRMVKAAFTLWEERQGIISITNSRGFGQMDFRTRPA